MSDASVWLLEHIEAPFGWYVSTHRPSWINLVDHSCCGEKVVSDKVGSSRNIRLTLASSPSHSVSQPTSPSLLSHASCNYQCLTDGLAPNFSRCWLVQLGWRQPNSVSKFVSRKRERSDLRWFRRFWHLQPPPPQIQIVRSQFSETALSRIQFAYV